GERVERVGVPSGVVDEEAFAIEELSRLQQSMADTCREAGTVIVAGDTKVMRKGEIDGIGVNTTGRGLTRHPVRDSAAAAGDVIIVTGTIGDHGMAVMAVRNQFQFAETLVSDVAPLNGLVR